MKVAAFTLSVLLACVIGFSVAQITFSRTWVRGQYPGGDGEGGNNNADFYREAKSELSSPRIAPVRRSAVKLINLSPSAYLRYLLQQGENAQRLRIPTPYSHFSHTNFVRVK